MAPRPRCLAATLLLCLLPAATAQRTSPDPALAPMLADLDEVAKDRKMERDLQALPLLQKLAKDYPSMHAKDQDRVAKAVGAVFRTGRPRPPGQTQLYDAAAATLAVMGSDGARELRKALDGERLGGREYVPVRAKLIEELGRTRDDKQIEWLLEQALRSPDDQIMAAAGGALGSFEAMETRLRRDVVKRLLARWGELESRGSIMDPTDPKAPVDFGPQNARATLARIRPRWQATLTTLTGQSFPDYQGWQRWQNKNSDWQPPRSKAADGK